MAAAKETARLAAAKDKAAAEAADPVQVARKLAQKTVRAAEKVVNTKPAVQAAAAAAAEAGDHDAGRVAHQRLMQQRAGLKAAKKSVKTAQQEVDAAIKTCDARKVHAKFLKRELHNAREQLACSGVTKADQWQKIIASYEESVLKVETLMKAAVDDKRAKEDLLTVAKTALAYAPAPTHHSLSLFLIIPLCCHQ